jgi:hypothetical protein
MGQMKPALCLLLDREETSPSRELDARKSSIESICLPPSNGRKDRQIVFPSQEGALIRYAAVDEDDGGLLLGYTQDRQDILHDGFFTELQAASVKAPPP